MSSHLLQVATAAEKCYDEAKKLENQFKQAKNDQERGKLKSQAEAAKKQTVAFYSQVDAAKQKDLKEIMMICDAIGSPKMH